MEDIVQIRVGRHLTGIIGWSAALSEVADHCKGFSDDRIGRRLFAILSKHNYFDAGAVTLYEEAFLREYKRSMGATVAGSPPTELQIKVLGLGCPQCDRLVQDVMTVIAEAGIVADVEHVRNPADIARYGVLGSPALVIDGRVKAVGSVPPKPQIKAWIEQAAQLKQ